MDAVARETLERYLEEMYAWNARINLTAVPRERAWGRHIEESLRLLDTAAPPPGGRLCDLGTGAGLPGVPAAVVRPDLRVVLCDSDQRRCAFLLHVIAALGLHATTVAPVRAEALGRDPAGRAGYDAVLSRALAAPPVLTELALPLLRVGGALHALVGDAGRASREAAEASRLCGGGPPVAIGGDVLEVRKVVDTPARYPRRNGVPSKRPLGRGGASTRPEPSPASGAGGGPEGAR